MAKVTVKGVDAEDRISELSLETKGEDRLVFAVKRWRKGDGTKGNFTDRQAYALTLVQTAVQGLDARLTANAGADPAGRFTLASELLEWRGALVPAVILKARLEHGLEEATFFIGEEQRKALRDFIEGCL